jgi:ribose transport system ATP-binding protein
VVHPPSLVARNLSKTFGGASPALDGVSFEVQAGEIHGLVGQNGSGKSTLIKILAGYHVPDPGGQIRLGGDPVASGSPAASESAGLRFVHQDLGLVETLDTVENLSLGPGFDTRRGLIRWSRARRSAAEAMERLGHRVDVTRPVAELPMSSRTAIAVARALSTRHGEPLVLVLDEPTANLPSHETERLFELVRRVSGEGVAVLFVSHRLDEVVANCVRTSVLRDGALVGTREMSEVRESDLVELMVGGRVESHRRDTGRALGGGRPVLEVRGLSTHTIHGIDLDVRAGEVVGVAGITGSGREELAPAVFGGVDRDGVVTVSGAAVPRLRPDRAIAAGVALVPADRHRNAMFADASVRENLSIVNLRAAARLGVIRKRAENARVRSWLSRLDVRPAAPDRMISTLSGGNQQKVVIARWLLQEPRVLVLDEPTQGVDVGAKAQIHGLIDKAAGTGTAVLVVSTESEELARLCDRVVVLRDGRVATVLHGDRITADQITAATLDSTFAGGGAAEAGAPPDEKES